MSRGRNDPRRKGTGKKKNQAQGLPKTALAVAVALLVIFIGGLYFIVHNKKESVQNTPQSAHQTKGHGLPPKPEERWSYIKELENRPVNGSSIQESEAALNQLPFNHSTQLTSEQKQLLEQMQTDMRQPPISLKEVPYNSEPVPRSRVVINPPAQETEQPTTSPAVTPRASNEVSTPKPAEIEARLMLQCGSFQTQEKAESVRASLAFSGIESQVTTKDNWHRVVLGPYKNKSGAEKMRDRVASAGVSGCILRPAGG
ncbi:cell division protein FtsN [Xenorhabdus hominickii]|uniref:Cell division protein FtsN n=1 Tax=Xenorhabdus hominickii TaxID=351679 RepID=A0A2G0QEK9_XENHO|nr:cell division protein FtsN [Xenorhabdus hominickii]